MCAQPLNPKALPPHKTLTVPAAHCLPQHRPNGSYIGLAKTIYIHTVSIRKGNHQMYGHARCVLTVLANLSLAARTAMNITQPSVPSRGAEADLNILSNFTDQPWGQ